MNIIPVRNTVNLVYKIGRPLITVTVRVISTTKISYGGYHLQYSPNAKLNKSILDRYMCLPFPECKVQAEYIWIDGTGQHLRSKTKTLDFVPTTYKDCPNWSYDGASSFQKEAKITEMYLCPIALYNDPIRRGHNKLVMCESYTAEQKPSKTNHRTSCMITLNKVCEHEPMFGFEQQFQIMDLDKRPFGWPAIRGEPSPENKYYCAVGGNRCFGRELIEAHYRACLYSGIQIFGVNAEVPLGQWEFQVGSTIGIKAGDDLWMARYLIQRIAEEYGLWASFHPKLFSNWFGAGCHVNFSSKAMRVDNGIQAIDEAICRLEKKHKDHLKHYDAHHGADNKERLIGIHDTAPYDKFVHAVGGSNVSVRIPKAVADAKKGYLEDRRPAANCDPYSVMNMLCKTILLCQE